MCELTQVGRGRVIRGKYFSYPSLPWLPAEKGRQGSRQNIQAKFTTYEISERSDGKWEVMDKTLKIKTYPNKETLLVALALQGVKIHES